MYGLLAMAMAKGFAKGVAMGILCFNAGSQSSQSRSR